MQKEELNIEHRKAKKMNNKIDIDIDEVKKLYSKLSKIKLSECEKELLEQVFDIANKEVTRMNSYAEKRRTDPYTNKLNKINCAINYARKTKNVDRLEMLKLEKERLMKEYNKI